MKLTRHLARPLPIVAAAALLTAVISISRCTEPRAASPELRFAVSFPAECSNVPLDGRLLLLISTDGNAEPRFQVSEGPGTQLVFGVDMEGLAPDVRRARDAGPLESA